MISLYGSLTKQEIFLINQLSPLFVRILILYMVSCTGQNYGVVKCMLVTNLYYEKF